MAKAELCYLNGVFHKLQTQLITFIKNKYSNIGIRL